MQVKNFPKSAGVYLMKDKDGVILYIGKAKNLQKRVGSYFKKEAKDRYQIKFLMERVKDIAYIPTASEKEAILLEYKLIQEHKPKYNIDLKDNKTFICVKISAHAFPAILVTRRVKKDGADYFGPYVSANVCREAVNYAVKFFKLRTCSDREFLNRATPCIQYDIGRCMAPCVSLVNKGDYSERVRQAKMFLNGQNSDLIKELREKMKRASVAMNFEEAAWARDLIKGIKIMLERQKVITVAAELALPSSSGKVYFASQMSILKNKLHLNKLPHVIECVDISNIQGKSASGSLVSFVNGLRDKKRYRLFNIKREEKPNDYAMMHEVLERRFSRKEWDKPDLLMVDGGRGQLSIACKVLESLNIKDVSIIAIAKIKSSHKKSSDNAQVFLPNRINLIKFKKGDQSLLYLIRIRDEAHRFGISHHRKRHLKKVMDI